MKKLFICLLALILAIFILPACSGGDSGKGRYDFGDEHGDSDAVVLSDLMEYTIIRGDLCSEGDKEACVTFNETVKKNLGMNLAISTDWIGAGQVEKEKEILIGTTERAESKEALKGLGFNDFVIRMIGKKLVIAGGSGSATKAAVDYFIENYIDIYQASLSYPKSGYKYVGNLLLSSVTIDGTPISEYKLYANDPEIELEDVQKAISGSVVGVEIDIAETTNAYTKYIVFDRTGLIASEYGVYLDDNGNLYVYGSYDSFATAKEYFMGAYFEELAAEAGSKDIDITWHNDKTKHIERAEIYSREELMSLLLDVYEDPNRIIVGETLGGSQATPAYTLETYMEAGGKYPAMLGIDLASHGLQLCEMSSEDWSMVICQLVDYASKGGIITATAHFENPTGNWELGDKSRGILGGEEKWEELLTRGSELSEKFTRELAIYAAFLKALSDNGVPVLWRPLHETNTDAYWFSAFQGDEKIEGEYLKRLWIYIYEYYEQIGIDSLIWVYSPAFDGGADTLPPLYAYPGDEYVDILGCDWLSGGTDELTADNSYAEMLSGRSKMGAICEFEADSARGMIAPTREEQLSLFSSADLLAELYSMRSMGLSFAYLVTENGTSSISWLGDAEAFLGDEMILTLDETAALLGVDP